MSPSVFHAGGPTHLPSGPLRTPMPAELGVPPTPAPRGLCSPANPCGPAGPRSPPKSEVHSCSCHIPRRLSLKSHLPHLAALWPWGKLLISLSPRLQRPKSGDHNALGLIQADCQGLGCEHTESLWPAALPLWWPRTPVRLPPRDWGINSCMGVQVSRFESGMGGTGIQILIFCLVASRPCELLDILNVTPASCQY